MSLAIIDAREWQKVFDLRTGAAAQDSGPLTGMMKAVLNRHPYPGDMDISSNRWVTDTALDVIDGYRPRFVFLTYAWQYYVSRFTQTSEEERHAMYAAVFEEVGRFVRESGFEPVVIGRGGMTPLLGDIDLSRIDGLAISSHWSARYAGLHRPSSADLNLLHAHPHIGMIVNRDEFLRLFNGTGRDEERVPDYIMVAERGYIFKTLGSTMRRPLMIPDAGDHIPVSCRQGEPGDITDIRGIIESRLKDTNIALINLEGVGTEEFQWPFTLCGNNREWFRYEPGDAQYLTITSGHYRALDYPPGYRYFAEDAEEKEYPLSGYFTSVPRGTIGEAFSGRSVAVGNKSMCMHMTTGADLCVECFARNLYNQGTMGVIHRQDKQR